MFILLGERAEELFEPHALHLHPYGERFLPHHGGDAVGLTAEGDDCLPRDFRKLLPRTVQNAVAFQERVLFFG